MKDVCLRSWSCAADQTIETLVLAMTTFHVSLGLLALFSAEAPLPLGKLVPPPTFAEFGAYAATTPPTTRVGDFDTTPTTRAPATHTWRTTDKAVQAMPTAPEGEQVKEDEKVLPDITSHEGDGDWILRESRDSTNDERDDSGVQAGDVRVKNHQTAPDYTIQNNNKGKEETYDDKMAKDRRGLLKNDLQRPEDLGRGDGDNDSGVQAGPENVRYHQEPLEYMTSAPDRTKGKASEAKLRSRELTGPPDAEVASFMQQPDDTGAWHAFLEALRGRFDAMDKLDRAVQVDYLLRRLDWHGTDSASGYFLGHMAGRTGQMTALLAAFRENVEVEPSAPAPQMAEGAWAELERFLPIHPGSQRAQGRPISMEEPCVMLSPREVPSEFLTPGYDSPEARRHGEPDRRKRQCLMVEVSSGSRDCPVLTRTLRVPLQDGRGDLRFHFEIREEQGSNTSETVPASPVGGGRTTLPVPAPDLLGEAGMSLVEYWKAEDKWRIGALNQLQLAQCYGEEVAGELVRRWRLQGHSAQDVGPTSAGESGEDIARAAPCGSREEEIQGAERAEDGAENPDETAMLTVGEVMGTLGVLATQGAAMEAERPSMDLIREHLFRQRGQGHTEREQASTLYYMMANRGCEEYMNQLPILFESIGLNVDVDLNARCLPGPTPFMTWVETEVWQEFVDYYEATIGHESEGLQALRGQQVMPEREQDEWRRWAGATRSEAAPARSRSPRRTGRTSTGRARPQQREGGHDEGRGEDSHGDVSSFMHRNTREDSRDKGGDRRRHRRDEGRDRERSRDDWSNSGGGGREARVRERVTRETRRLLPTTCWAEWGEEGGRRDRPRGSEPASASTTTRRPPTRGDRTDGELDILQATGEWLVLFGLRSSGEEQVEPQNAITRERQARARTLLTSLPERDLNMMIRALLRLTGMLYIEAARLVTQVQDTRRRNSELVEVEVEPEQESDESIYMQQAIQFSRPQSWENLLQELVVLADKAEEGDKWLLMGLRRRIESSLFLQTPRGCQLQAVLVAIAQDREARVIPCETEENDGVMLEAWWSRLKAHMSLGHGEDASARGSQDSPDVILDAGLGAMVEHDPKMVEAWEVERRQLEKEREKERQVREQEQDGREEEERRQNEADLLLYQAHEGEVYKNWENWVVLNSPTQPKRRRLVVATHGQGSDAAASTSTTQAELWVPERLETMQIVLQLKREPDVPRPGAVEEQISAGGQASLDLKDEKYQKVYEAWKAGEITNRGISLVYGDDWLMLFEVMRDGAGGGATLPDDEGDELPAGGRPGEGSEPAMVTTQLDEGGEDGMAGSRTWGQRIQVGIDTVVKDVEQLEKGE